MSLACLISGTPVREADELLTSDRLRELMLDLVREFDVVVIDSPPLLVVPDALELLPLTDAQLVCVRAGRTTRPELTAVREILERIRATRAGAVVTGAAKPEYEADGYFVERDLTPQRVA